MSIYHASDDEVAAAFAAIAIFLSEADSSDNQQLDEPCQRWNDSVKLVTQQMHPARTPARPHWNTVERLRRAQEGGLYGVVGL